MIYERIMQIRSGRWEVGIIEDHQARSMTEEEMTQVLIKLNATPLPGNSGLRAYVAGWLNSAGQSFEGRQDCIDSAHKAYAKWADALHQIEMGMEDWKVHGCRDRARFAENILAALGRPAQTQGVEPPFVAPCRICGKSLSQGNHVAIPMGNHAYDPNPPADTQGREIYGKYGGVIGHTGKPPEPQRWRCKVCASRGKLLHPVDGDHKYDPEPVEPAEGDDEARLIAGGTEALPE